MWMKSVAVGKEKGLWNPGASHFVLHFSSSSLPLLYSEQKEQAVRLVDKAIIIAQRLLDSNHMMLADYLSIQGALLSDPLPSKPVFEQCLDIKTQHLPMDHPNPPLYAVSRLDIDGMEHPRGHQGLCRIVESGGRESAMAEEPAWSPY